MKEHEDILKNLFVKKFTELRKLIDSPSRRGWKGWTHAQLIEIATEHAPRLLVAAEENVELRALLGEARSCVGRIAFGCSDTDDLVLLLARIDTALKSRT